MILQIKDEYSFITDLSYHLSSRYQRPISSIVINLNHGCCMMFGGTFDPAYTLTIHALPCLVQPTTNKRNAALIQQHIQETLGVITSRGYVRFVATPEENVAVGGKTIAAEIEKSSNATADDKPAETRKHAKSNRRIGVKVLFPPLARMLNWIAGPLANIVAVFWGLQIRLNDRSCKSSHPATEHFG